MAWDDEDEEEEEVEVERSACHILLLDEAD